MKDLPANRLLQEAEAFLDDFMLQKAEKVIRQALQKEPANHQAHALMAKACLYSQREELALDHAHKAHGTRLGEFVAHRLAEHFLCVTQMAIRTDTPNPKAFRMLDDAQRLAGEVPQHAGIDLTAVLIVKNEEAHLANCLKSLEGVVNEIVVVDTGSTDGTIKIAESFGAVIGQFAWCDDFAAARNAALELATGNWALWIDADEELTAASKSVIRRALVRPQYAGFNIPIINYTEDQGESDQFVHAPVRLFRLLPGVAFTGRIHEQVAESLLTHGLPLAHLEGAWLLHHGYRPAVMAERNKLDRTVTMLERELEENPDDSFQWFNLGNAYSIAKRYEDAERACRLSIEKLVGTESHAQNAFQVLIEMLEQQGRYDDALGVIAEAESSGLGWVQTEYTKASILLSMGRYGEALAAIEHTMRMDWPIGRSGDYSIVTYKRTGLHGQILLALGRHQEAEEALRASLQVNDNPNLRWSLGILLESVERTEEAIKVYGGLVGDPTFGESAQLGVARCSLKSGHPEQSVKVFEEAFLANPSNQDAWVGWVSAAEQLGDVAQVLRAYEEYAKHQDLSAGLLINWGRSLEANGSLNKALDCFSEAIKRNPDEPNAYFNCGDVLYRLQQYPDAAHMYEGGLQRDPENVNGWFVLGNALAQMDLIEGAQLAYRQCLSMQPDHAGASHNLAIISQAA